MGQGPGVDESQEQNILTLLGSTGGEWKTKPVDAPIMPAASDPNWAEIHQTSPQPHLTDGGHLHDIGTWYP